MHKTCLSLFLALDSMKLDSAQAAHCSLVSTMYPLPRYEPDHSPIEISHACV